MLKNVNNIFTYSFTDLFNNFDLNDVHNIKNDMFQKYFANLKLTKTIEDGYFKTLKIIINYKVCIVHNSKIYFQMTDIAQGGGSSSMLGNIFLYYYECNYINNYLHLYRYIDYIILDSTDNITCSVPATYSSSFK